MLPLVDCVSGNNRQPERQAGKGMGTIEKVESKLVIESKLDAIAEARRWLAKLAGQAGFTPQEVSDLKLVLTEACSNIVKHAYQGEAGHEIVLSLSIAEDELALTIQDFGRKIDLSKYQEPDLDVPHEGGYGIYIIETLMDGVEYDTSPQTGTILNMIKRKGQKAR
jgi:serine/threonine-protein kinase RsbW